MVPQQRPCPVPSAEQSFRIADLVGATSGSSGLDLCASARAVLTPQMGVQALPTRAHGPLPPGTMGLILGRSSTLLKGIQIHPGIVDTDYKEEIKIMASVQQGVVAIPRGEQIAQLVLIPNKVTNNK